jgi:hypothetical protein
MTTDEREDKPISMDVIQSAMKFAQELFTHAPFTALSMNDACLSHSDCGDLIVEWIRRNGRLSLFFGEKDPDSFVFIRRNSDVQPKRYCVQGKTTEIDRMITLFYTLEPD